LRRVASYLALTGSCTSTVTSVVKYLEITHLSCLYSVVNLIGTGSHIVSSCRLTVVNVTSLSMKLTREQKILQTMFAMAVVAAETREILYVDVCIIGFRKRW